MLLNMYTHIVKDRAMQLRKEGYSYTFIAKKTGVSKGTLSSWLSAIEFSPNQYTQKAIGEALSASISKKAQAKRSSIEEAKVSAQKIIGHFTQRDLLILGIGLYIGEGSKTQNLVRIVNADYKVIRTSIKWFTEIFGIPKTHIKVRLHLYPDISVKEATDFWSDAIGLSRDNFQKPCIDRRANKTIHRKSSYGTAHITISAMGKKDYGVKLSRKISALMEEVLQ